ncbi:vacuolar protein 8 isoform X2 [Momordica charantia]|uniref:Vacuolar protein 8 isoform X2 n=1 Tax=Momordica charantia TaxID=3673 RepID=A0A6J1CB33_MOMCH|nr:vacuolar protein 8 isoform X2 [Momordica charantia]XP_022137699.1 vacuolar protein 8 isoform X2 [Momordica charantia]
MKVPLENDHFAVSNQLISSLLDDIPVISNFKGKWSSIRAKLSDLRTQLLDVSEFPNSSSNPLSLDFLHSVFEALSEATSLSQRCRNPELSGGKLKTQSDVDSVLAKLDCLLRDGDVLIRSEILHDGAVSSSSSKREAVRAESRNLITRLQIGSIESRIFAIDSLLQLLNEDDKNVTIAAAQGVVPVLVRLLDSSSLELKERAVAAISIVSMVDGVKHVLIAEGLPLLNHLLRILDSGSGFAKEKACLTLQPLSISKENARSIGSRGGIASLLEICEAGTPGSQASAAAVLRNLALFSEIKGNFMEENGVIVLLGLLASGTPLAQENAIGCLCNLVVDDDNLKLLIVREGGIEFLRNFWDSAPSVRSLEVAVELLRLLALYSPLAEALISDGFIDRLLPVLSCGVLGVRTAAARAVYELGFCTKTRKEMGEAGFITPLVNMLDGKSVDEKEAAAKALSSLLQYTGNRKIFQKEERGIVSAVQLLDPSITNLDKKYPVSLLSSVVISSKCRKQMAAADAGLYLQKLVEMNVEGSKKLLESLVRGKIWGVFPRS